MDNFFSSLISIFIISVMGCALMNGLSLVGTSQNANTSNTIRQQIDQMESMLNNNNITTRERMHVEAVKMFSVG